MLKTRLCLVAVLASAFSSLAPASVVLVTTPTDVVDFAAPQTIGKLPGPDGVVSMREAAIAVNNTPGIHTIGFTIGAALWGTSTIGPVLINAGNPFPISASDVTIDGTFQTNFTGDTNPNGAEVSFFSTTTNPTLIQTGIFQITGDRVHVIGLGDMLGRNYGLDFLPSAEDGTVTQCVIKGKFAAIRVQGDRITIGSALPGQGNSLRSLSDGLRIHGFGGAVAQDNVVIGNFLTGEFNGVQIVGDATGNIIGGFGPGEANLISNAGYEQEDLTPDGAMVRIESDGNFVLGNLIGTDASGTAAAANNIADVGVEIYGDHNDVIGNVIGGITGIAGFLSVQAGISLREGAELNRVQGNWIGVDKTGLFPIPNHIGIQISAFDPSMPMPGQNLVGGLAPGEANVIAFNEENGIRIQFDSTSNRISGNSIHDNHPTAAIGIDLGADGPTPDDAGDVDTGPNMLMNRPQILSAVSSPADGTVISGVIDTANPTTAQIEFFANPAPAPAEVVEAKQFLGVTQPLANGAFAVAFSIDTTGLAITATATDAAGNTSEISPHMIATASPWANLGFALPEPGGTPTLAGGGPLTPNSPIALITSAPALPSAQAYWIVGLSPINAAFFGGTLVPAPLVIIPVTTDANGKSIITATWPSVASGTKLYVHTWIVAPNGVQGFAATNAIVGTTP